MLRNRPGYLWRWSGIPALQKLDDAAARFEHCIFIIPLVDDLIVAFVPFVHMEDPRVFVISATEMAAPCPTTKVQQSGSSVVTAITPSQIVQGLEP